MPDPSDPQVVWHQHVVTRDMREKAAGHRGFVLWFTGLSGSGKSTIAGVVDQKLHALGVRTYLLDGDNVRHSLNAAPKMLEERYGTEFSQRFGLGFGQQDRSENIRRIGAVAGLFCDAGLATLTAFVSPYRADRDAVRAALPAGDFIEVFVDTPLEVCESRDPKGLYAKARAGEIKGFTGIDDPYEPPLSAEVVLATAEHSVDAMADKVVHFLKSSDKIS